MPSTAEKLQVDDDQPRYRQIYTLLRDRIGSGHYPIGSNLPTEVELCAEFGVSRYTVREALRRLVDQGMLARRQGSGSAVLAHEPQHNFVHHVRSLADLFQYALDTHLQILAVEHVTLGAELAESVGGAEGSGWLLVRALRLTRPGGEPICVTHSYIPERFAWIEPEIPDCVGPFYALLEARSGEAISDAVQEIKAEPMPPAVAAALGAEPGAFALRLLRRYASRKGTLIASFNWHPADVFTYRMQLQRSPAH
ncbi:GntR family transcriptional regulator [Aquibium sp. A9E412]|uniref:GntR family transcriptional regulator n=1 Tax=Aquibium sp. A9E412 TaxID=2976767 RepID=UPI0025B022F2|nr:GntR family transcriptional regulator [Aquibium sp. A9E412]MDN2567592.1 GntR family transcriptional regulator [Aquibium sp. A9E412]